MLLTCSVIRDITTGKGMVRTVAIVVNRPLRKAEYLHTQPD